MRDNKYFKNLKEIPFPYAEKTYAGLDQRDCFNLDTSLIAWLYEHLQAYYDEANVSIDLMEHKYSINGEELNEKECIFRMIEDCKIILDTWEYENFAKRDAAKNDLFDVLKECIWSLWY